MIVADNILYDIDQETFDRAYKWLSHLAFKLTSYCIDNEYDIVSYARQVSEETGETVSEIVEQWADDSHLIDWAEQVKECRTIHQENIDIDPAGGYGLQSHI